MDPTREGWLRSMRECLALIRECDERGEYDLRNQLILSVMVDAQALGYAAGFRFDAQEPEWPVAYIELPTGQVSWHLPQHPLVWDGHTTAEKYERVRRFVEGV
jgi:hypothetical protein